MQISADSITVPVPVNSEAKHSRTLQTSHVANVLVNSVLIALLVYTSISVVAGKAGLVSQQSLKRQLKAMEERLFTLKEQNVRLSQELESLIRDPEKIAREARKMGYVAPDEYIVRIVTPQSPVVDLGSMEMIRDSLVLRAQESPGLPDMLIKKMAGVAFISAFFLGFIFSLYRSAFRKSDKSSQGNNEASRPSPV